MNEGHAREGDSSGKFRERITRLRDKIEFNNRRTAEYLQQIGNNQAGNAEYLDSIMRLVDRLEAELAAEVHNG